MFRIDKKGFVHPDAEIKESPGAGRGVFATRKYSKNELIERAPTFTCNNHLLDELMNLNQGRTIFHDYVFNDGGIVHIGLGWSSMYNHNHDSNARWNVDNEKEIIEIRAKKEIMPGEEITVVYVVSDTMLWF